jgi:hypothetical protein
MSLTGDAPDCRGLCADSGMAVRGMHPQPYSGVAPTTPATRGA